MADLYDGWCRNRQSVDGIKTLWRLVERGRGREFALDMLPERVLDHYLADDVNGGENMYRHGGVKMYHWARR